MGITITKKELLELIAKIDAQTKYDAICLSCEEVMDDLGCYCDRDD